MKINKTLKPADLTQKIENFLTISGDKIRRIAKEYDESLGSPVFTEQGKYTSRGWTEWTQGFQYGSSLLQYDATGEEWFLDNGRTNTVEKMASHVSHTGVHDHGFNTVSTYGNLLRMMSEGSVPKDKWEQNFCELGIKVSGAVQASRWTKVKDGGFIYSFNGPHSLFVDTIRSCRVLCLSHLLGHVLWEENDKVINLYERALNHIKATAQYSIYYGEDRDLYDIRGRTAHESIFNINDGKYRCASSQQGYSPFSTWTRGLAWAMCGFSEQLEFLDILSDEELLDFGGREAIRAVMLKAAKATCDFYIENTPEDGVPYWDTGAPNLYKLGDYLSRPADPFNEYEPVDSSAAAIGAQGLLRLGKWLKDTQNDGAGHYFQAGLTILDILLDEPYLCTDPEHQGLLLHSIYHRPNGWDHTPEGQKIPCGESSMWGDYHIREAVIYVRKLIEDGPYYTFFGGIKQ